MLSFATHPPPAEVLLLNSASTLDRKYVALAIFAFAIGGFAIGTNEFAIMGLLDEMQRALGVSTANAGYVIAAYALGVVVGAPVFAAVGAKMPRKRLVVGLMVFYALANFVSFLVHDSYALLMVSRFLSGVPHGAFFGVAGVVAASLVAPTRRAWAISMVMMGLSVANVIGVPLATWLGQNTVWQSMFLVVSVISALCVAMMLLYVPHEPAPSEASIRRELGALGKIQVWLALATGAIGFGGFFAVYTYVAPTILQVTKLPDTILPIITALYGLGMVCGNYLGGRLADWSIMGTVYLVLAATAIVLCLYNWLIPIPAFAFVLVFIVGATGSSLVPALQSRLLDAAPHAPSLAASLNHSALNIGNFLGAYLGGLVIAAGWGLQAPPLVGAALALVGLGIALISGWLPMPAHPDHAAGPESPNAASA